MRIGTDIVEVSRIQRAITNWQSDFYSASLPARKYKINREDPNYERASGFWAAKRRLLRRLAVDIATASPLRILK